MVDRHHVAGRAHGSGSSSRTYITVTYQVGEQIYIEQLLTPYEAVGRLRIGYYVTLFYDPTNPRRVTTGIVSIPDIILFVGFVIMIAVIIYTAIKGPKNQREYGDIANDRGTKK